MFSYNELKKAEKNGTRLGNWKGLPVFACKKENLKNKGNGAYYIIYDDNNTIVRIQNGMVMQYGTCDNKGNVDELSKVTTYKYKVEEERDEPARASTIPVASGKYADSVDMDFKMTNDVEAMLHKARAMTLDDLLDGFNYGLEGAKG